jgi:hypothetical protein
VVAKRWIWLKTALFSLAEAPRYQTLEPCPMIFS